MVCVVFFESAFSTIRCWGRGRSAGLGSLANLSSDFNPLVDFVARERSLQTIEFRDFRPDVILSMQKRALTALRMLSCPDVPRP